MRFSRAYEGHIGKRFELRFQPEGNEVLSECSTMSDVVHLPILQ